MGAVACCYCCCCCCEAAAATAFTPPCFSDFNKKPMTAGSVALLSWWLASSRAQGRRRQVAQQAALIPRIESLRFQWINHHFVKKARQRKNFGAFLPALTGFGARLW
jgi:hypothetical protein